MRAGVHQASTPLVEVPKQWQAALMQGLSQARLAELQGASTTASKLRLKSAAMPGASAWLRVMPVGELFLTDMQIQLQLKLWLGLPLPTPAPHAGSSSACCIHKGQHPLTCALIPQAPRQADMLQAWSLIMQVAGVPARVKPAADRPEHSERTDTATAPASARCGAPSISRGHLGARLPTAVTPATARTY